MNISVPDPEVRNEGREQITNINVKVSMPDGSSQTIDIDQGQTVEYVRAYIHEHFGVPFEGSSLMYNGKPMFDPMSLCDLGVVSGGNIECKVTGGAADGGDM